MKFLKKKAIVGALLTLVTGTLLAQPVDPRAPRASGDAEATVTVNLTVEQMTVKLGEIEKTTAEDARLVAILQLKARKDKDVIRLNCINDKLVQIKALRNILDNARQEFEAGGPDQRAKFSVANDTSVQIQQLREAAFVCAGEVELEADQDVSWDGPDIPDDPSDDMFPDPIEPPAYASPFN